MAGDNQNARAIAGLASAALPGGGTPLDGWSALVYRVAPATAFGFGKGKQFSQTRWRFA